MLFLAVFLIFLFSFSSFAASEINPPLGQWNSTFDYRSLISDAFHLVWSDEFNYRSNEEFYQVVSPFNPNTYIPPLNPNSTGSIGFLRNSSTLGPVQFPDARNWGHDNCHGCGNAELEYYTNSLNNSFIYDGYLYLVARNETAADAASPRYTSARLVSSGKFNFTFGVFAASIIAPEGQGIWPAWWLLGESVNDPSVGWPSCGEIDVFEQVGGFDVENGNEDAINHSSFHWNRNGINQTNSDHASITNTIRQPQNVSLSQREYVYWGKWDELKGTIELGINEFSVETMNYSQIEQYYNSLPISKETFNGKMGPFYFLFNIAVGGYWPGNPDAALGTVFPQTMRVDWIRVWQLNEVATGSSSTGSVGPISSSAAAASTGSALSSGGASTATGSSNMTAISPSASASAAASTGPMQSSTAVPSASAIQPSNSTQFSSSAAASTGAAKSSSAAVLSNSAISATGSNPTAPSSTGAKQNFSLSSSGTRNPIVSASASSSAASTGQIQSSTQISSSAAATGTAKSSSAAAQSNSAISTTATGSSSGSNPATQSSTGAAAKSQSSSGTGKPVASASSSSSSSSSSTGSSAPSKSDDDDSMKTKTKVAIAVSVTTIGLIGIIVLVYWVRKRRSNRRSLDDDLYDNSDNYRQINNP